MRGEVWTISAGSAISKPRPAVIVQGDGVETADTVLVYPLTSFGGGRAIEPSPSNGLARPSRPMAHRTAAVKRKRLGELVGTLSDADMELVDEQLRAAFGL